MILSPSPLWLSMNTYLGSLTKRYRAAAKKARKPFESTSLNVAPTLDTRSEAGRTLDLRKAIAAKADICLFVLSSTTLPRLAESLGASL